MKSVFYSGSKVVGIGVGHAPGVVFGGNDGTMVASVSIDLPVEIGWNVDDVDGELRFVAPALQPPTVGPNEFHFLWTMAEQLKIEELRGSDPVIELFMRRLDDPRTVEVVLSAPAVQAAIVHTVDALVTAGLVEASARDERIAEILKGGK